MKGEKNMGRKYASIRTYKRKPQIWFGTEADSFSYDFVWHLPIQMCLDGENLNLKREVKRESGTVDHPAPLHDGTYDCNGRIDKTWSLYVHDGRNDHYYPNFFYSEYVSEKRNIKQENKDREAIDYQTPTLSMLQDMVLEYSSRIYERSILDDDFLKVNLGYRKGES